MKKIINLKTILVLILLILFVILLKNIDKTDQKSIKIGQISALSGVGSDIGTEERNAALLAVEQINAKGGVLGKNIELVSEDISFEKLNQTGTVFQKLTNVDSVVAIVGPQWDEAGSIIAALSKDFKVPVVSPNVSPQVELNIDSPYFFSTFYSNEVGIEVLLQFAQSRGYKRIAIIQPASFGFWKYTSDLFKQHANQYGIEIVSEEYGSGFENTDYKTLIAKAKQSDPDAIFGSYADLQCLFIQQAKNQGLHIPLLSTESAGTLKTLKECGTILEDALYFSTPKQEQKYVDFEKAYEARFGAKPLSPSAVTSYDAVYVVAHAIEDAQSIKHADIRDALSKIEYKDSASMSKIMFDEKGFVRTLQDAFTIKGVEDKAFVEINR